MTKTVLVTGASSGIGRAQALTFLENGYRVYGVDKDENPGVRFGTNGERGTGLGLALCRDLLEKNRSRLIVESRQQVGTTVGFTLRKN